MVIPFSHNFGERDGGGGGTNPVMEERNPSGLFFVLRGIPVVYSTSRDLKSQSYLLQSRTWSVRHVRSNI